MLKQFVVNYILGYVGFILPFEGNSTTAQRPDNLRFLHLLPNKPFQEQLLPRSAKKRVTTTQITYSYDILLFTIRLLIVI